ncbi:cold shock domain-containing protein [Elizabethkingia argentiflava]|uniref:Cold shock domain-containing protein n=1 Tax=Elizabethkingia argenteiflava TaxID=2681556 RepID=A0A845PX33_9FLAO|nr:cold shock domain-containing protein [Elizabethkingia argenteiflava]NAW50878.1 cold shock domain-containing protein [Elizabethkingia argenteiflava]
MADSFSKKENNKKKIQKQKEKAKRREERKTLNNKGKSLNEMMAFVDINGQISATPPDNSNFPDIKLEDIQLGAAIVQRETVLTGIVTFFSVKGYGFITETQTKESLFFHNNDCIVPIQKGDKVSFEKEKTTRGFAAINIQLYK